MAPRILVVDDDDAVRMTVALMLQREGYAVDAAPDGAAGLAAAERERFDLVVTNTWMPRMNGDELSAHLRRLYPGIPILHISSFPGDGSSAFPPSERQLSKPFPLAVLRSTVRDMAGPARE